MQIHETNRVDPAAEKSVEAAGDLTGAPRAKLTMNLHVLRELLRLPPSVYVEAVIQTNDDRIAGNATIILCGEGLPPESRRIGMPADARLEFVHLGVSNEPAFEAKIVIG